ncbi:YcaO-like family protein [Sorangium sp. So ce321]|uniref:YcaO-like family protein n=1 Tax=Sorangium sp. So ce321 TaxID=3133300 RepID=UPI003F6457FE
MPEETLARVQPLMRAVGITRISDITGLDRLGIPVWSSVVPKSRDMLSVYNGKGATHIGAKVGAIMEAFERHAGLTFERPFIRTSYNSISKQRRALDPEAAGIVMHPTYTKDKEILWTEGHDLFTGEEILVPADLAGYNSIHAADQAVRAYLICTTNGLASGNTYEEAIAQALCEVIERDAWTIATILAHWLPRARFEAERAKAGLPRLEWGGKDEQPFSDDGDRYPVIDPSTLDGEVRQVCDMYVAAGLPPTLRDITSDIGVPTMVVTVSEEVSPDFPRAHIGVGAHQDRRVAALRALTEAAQSRVVDIQGVREDMTSAEEKTSKYMSHAKRVSRINRKNWLHMETSNKRSFADIPSLQTEDTLDDIKAMLDGLRACDLNLAIEVDVTNPEIGIPVTRVIVPGLESWAADHGRVGKRGAKHWNAHRASSLRKR